MFSACSNRRRSLVTISKIVHNIECSKQPILAFIMLNKSGNFTKKPVPSHVDLFLRRLLAVNLLQLYKFNLPLSYCGFAPVDVPFDRAAAQSSDIVFVYIPY